LWTTSANPFGLRYKGIELDKCRTKKSKWEVQSETYGDLEAAHFWRLKPSEFWASSVEDKAYMTAFMEAKNKIEAVESFELDQEYKKGKG